MVDEEILRKGVNTMSNIRRRRVRISKQRQFTIPKEFFEASNLGDDAYIEFNTDTKELSIKPTEIEVVDFSEQIIADLIAQGYEGHQLLEKFKKIKKEIPAALEKMKADTMKQSLITGSLDDYLDTSEVTDEDE